MTQILNVGQYRNNVNMMGAPAESAPLGNVGAPESARQAPGAVPVQNVQKAVAKDVGQLSSDSYLRHCDNGVKALCENYNICDSEKIVPDKVQQGRNLSVSSAELNFDAKELEGLADRKSMFEIKDPVLKDMCWKLAKSISKPEMPFKTMVMLLQIALRSNQVQQMISDEKHISQAIFSISGQSLKEKLSQSAAADVRDKICDMIVDKFMRTGGDNALMPDHWRVVLEGDTYDMNSAGDMVQIFNKASFRMVDQCGDKGDFAEIQKRAEKLVHWNRLGFRGDTPAQQMETLAECNSTLNKYIASMTKLVKSGGLTGEALALAKEHLDTALALSIQFKAVAKGALQNKILEAQAEHVREIHEKGGSKMCTVSIEAGPEFSILDNRFSVGAKLAFTYTFLVQVPHPHGPISISNSIQAGVKAEGNFGVKTDPVSGKVTIQGSYSHVSTHRYDTPEAVADAEGGRMLQKMMHYAKPLELPKDDGENVVAKVENAGRRIAGFFKTIGNGIAGIFKPSAAKLAKQALLQNEVFKEKMKRIGVFGKNVTLLRKSVNRELAMSIISKSGSATATGEEKLALKNLSMDQKVAFTYTKTTMTSYGGLISKLDTADKLAEFLTKEYSEIDDKRTTALLKKEIKEFQEIRDNNHKPDATDILKRILELSGEFNWFCKETNKVDMAKIGLCKKNTVDRQQLMASRSASNRGEFFRSTLTRLAALKYQLEMVKTGKVLENDRKTLNFCEKLLAKMQPEFEKPPVILSKKNAACIHVAEKMVIANKNLEIGFNATLPPSPSGASTKVGANLKFTFPSDKKSGYYRKHNSATLSFSLTGSQLAQMGIHAISHIVNQVADQRISAKSSGGHDTFVDIVAESAKDLVADVANNALGNAIQNAVNESLKKHVLTMKNADGGSMSMGDVLNLMIMNNETFTVSLNFVGNGKGVSFGGLDITDSRSTTILVKAGVPVSPTVTVAGKVTQTMSSTHQVLSQLGTKTMAPLVDATFAVGSRPKAIQNYLKRHGKELTEMSANCVKNGTALNAELKNYMKNLAENLKTCLPASSGNTKADRNAQERAMKLMGLAKGFMDKLALLKDGEALAESEEMKALQAEVQALAEKMAANGGMNAGGPQQKQNTAPVEANRALYDLANVMYLLDYVL